jgi:hypothetical protein
MRSVEAGEGEDHPISALEELLDTEITAIQSADFTGLDAFADRKEALLAALTSGPAPEPRAIERLRAKARRNAAALDAAGRGLRAAGRRMAELARAGRPETYDAGGRRKGLAPATGKLEHRA